MNTNAKKTSIETEQEYVPGELYEKVSNEILERNLNLYKRLANEDAE